MKSLLRVSFLILLNCQTYVFAASVITDLGDGRVLTEQGAAVPGASGAYTLIRRGSLNFVGEQQDVVVAKFPPERYNIFFKKIVADNRLTQTIGSEEWAVKPLFFTFTDWQTETTFLGEFSRQDLRPLRVWPEGEDPKNYQEITIDELKRKVQKAKIIYPNAGSAIGILIDTEYLKKTKVEQINFLMNITGKLLAVHRGMFKNQFYHGDPNLENFLMNSTNEVKAIDFEKLIYQPDPVLLEAALQTQFRGVLKEILIKLGYSYLSPWRDIPRETFVSKALDNDLNTNDKQAHKGYSNFIEQVLTPLLYDESAISKENIYYGIQTALSSARRLYLFRQCSIFFQ